MKLKKKISCLEDGIEVIDLAYAKARPTQKFTFFKLLEEPEQVLYTLYDMGQFVDAISSFGLPGAIERAAGYREWKETQEVYEHQLSVLFILGHTETIDTRGFEKISRAAAELCAGSDGGKWFMTLVKDVVEFLCDTYYLRFSRNGKMEFPLPAWFGDALGWLVQIAGRISKRHAHLTFPYMELAFAYCVANSRSVLQPVLYAGACLHAWQALVRPAEPYRSRLAGYTRAACLEADGALKDLDIDEVLRLLHFFLAAYIFCHSGGGRL